MKAAVFKKYGPPEVVEVVEVEKPTPGSDEVLVLKSTRQNPAGNNRS